MMATIYFMARGETNEGAFGIEALIASGSAVVTLNERISTFYSEHRQALYRYLLLSGVTPAEAQELTQEAFLSLYRVLRCGQTIQNWRAWVFRVAHNLAVNRGKAAGPDQSLDASEDWQVAAGGTDPETHAILKQRGERLRAALALLSPQQRHCLHLRADGFRYREIADILGIAQPTAGEFLRRAILRLRKAVL